MIIALGGTPDGAPEARLFLSAAIVLVASFVSRIVIPKFRVDAEELGRLWLVGLGALWLAEPLMTAQSNGVGDSQWYSLVMADAVAQWRAGFLPP